MTAGGLAWIWFRDWTPPDSTPLQTLRAQTAARTVCGGCRVRVLERQPSGRWLVRMSGSRSSACATLAVDPGPAGRPTGVRRVRCPSPPAGDGTLVP